MIKIGITGSLASGKTTASKILSFRRGPLFSADKIVKDLYKKKTFSSLVSKRFKIKKKYQLKKSVKNLILINQKNIKKLERIIHPLVREKMKDFTLKNRNNKFLFYEVPLLIENKLKKYFNVVIFIKAAKQLRLKRFQSKSGDKMLFNLLNNKQMPDTKKIRFCDHVVVNEKNINNLKEKLFNIMRKYE